MGPAMAKRPGMRASTVVLLFLILCLFTSCIEVKQGININRDGSGDAQLEVAIQKEFASMVIPKLKADAPKTWKFVAEKDKEGQRVVTFSTKFKDISELTDGDTRYTCSSKKEHFLKRSYSLYIEQLKTSDMPFPYEIDIKVPGSINETNGAKLSSNEVKWNLWGFRKGEKLYVKSTAFVFWPW